jgi:hypothetical protein
MGLPQDRIKDYNGGGGGSLIFVFLDPNKTPVANNWIQREGRTD